MIQVNYLVIGIYLELACLPVGREFGYWDLAPTPRCGGLRSSWLLPGSTHPGQTGLRP
jgi:hypothetical protein